MEVREGDEQVGTYPYSIAYDIVESVYLPEDIIVGTLTRRLSLIPPFGDDRLGPGKTLDYGREYVVLGMIGSFVISMEQTYKDLWGDKHNLMDDNVCVINPEILGTEIFNNALRRIACAEMVLAYKSSKSQDEEMAYLRVGLFMKYILEEHMSDGTEEQPSHKTREEKKQSFARKKARVLITILSGKLKRIADFRDRFLGVREPSEDDEEEAQATESKGRERERVLSYADYKLIYLASGVAKLGMNLRRISRMRTSLVSIASRGS